MSYKSFYLWILAFLMPVFAFSQEAFVITHGPYLQAVGEQNASFVWTTNRNSISWVEIAPDDSSHFYHTERPKYFAVEHGFKKVSTVHNVKVEGLKPGTKYRYRIYSQEVLKHEGTNVQYGKVAATAVYQKQPLAFVTNTKDKNKVTFGVVNDIHGRNEVMTSLIGNLKLNETDLVFFNGDMANNFFSEKQVFTDFMNTGVKLFASETPMYYARGNHETRGPFAKEFADYFPSSSGNLYYMVRQGPICFIVLDGGEDKPDSDIEYSGIVAFDEYRTKQAEWLKQALESPEYKNAPYKVVICHVPPFGGWHGEHEIAEKFVPLLNAAKAQIMLSGHLHKHVKKEADPASHNFPILVNSNQTMIRATADKQQLKIDVVDQQGKVVDSITVLPSL